MLETPSGVAVSSLLAWVPRRRDVRLWGHHRHPRRDRRKGEAALPSSTGAAGSRVAGAGGLSGDVFPPGSAGAGGGT